ncbi:MAG TPA: alpha/beta hydrolase [Candidatus Elarobacter sp.]|nr:alpha/beta hydrolase [Candidatus Elarobacter sp.]
MWERIRGVVHCGAAAGLIVFMLRGAAVGQVAAPAPPGRLVDVGGWRLHLNCTGSPSASPAVVFEAGGGDFSLDWALVQKPVSEFAQACSYDRAGAAWSELGPRPRTMQQIAYELHAALHNAGVQGPYVLVGHSIGGLFVRTFAALYPADVAGMVLVDPTTEESVFNTNGKLVRQRDLSQGRAIPPVRQTIAPDERRLLLSESARLASFLANQQPAAIESPYDKLPADVQQLRLWAMAQPAHWTADGGDYWPEEFQGFHDAKLRDPRPLHDAPLAVLVRAARSGGSAEQMAADAARLSEKSTLTELSTNSELIVVAHSGHHIHLDAPAAVTAAVREVVEAARAHRPLRARGTTRTL